MTDPSHRIERLADQIRGEVATVIAEDLRDPRIGFATVTRVELSADLQHARVLVSVLGDAAAQEQTLQGLASAAGYVRYAVTHRLRLRRAPELIFVLDHGPEESIRLEKLLHNLHQHDHEK
ncbi:MAG TPA: 30S ribosome-binding factor RbfA [Terriglobia bacterium]|nr:30S ribosome-binding factor RbfA [Terriglobia bacterium]